MHEKEATVEALPEIHFLKAKYIWNQGECNSCKFLEINSMNLFICLLYLLILKW